MLEIEPIAHIFTGFPEKFGIPRQSGLADTVGKIVFEEKYRCDEALRGLLEFSHIWLIWEFSDISSKRQWSPTVRPPRLGGNKRIGVFATRSPNRPNPLGLSCVKITSIEKEESGTVIYVSGADIMDNTPIFDIKPYIPFADKIDDAKGGYTDETKEYFLNVNIPSEVAEGVPDDILSVIYDLLKHDPRPSYQDDEDRVYGMSYSGYEVRFCVSDGTLAVSDISLSDVPAD